MNLSNFLPKHLESNVLIRFEDCDPFGHLNNGRYIDYFLNAREDQLREQYGLDIYAHMKETGNAWVVASNQIAYLREVKLMEVVKIKTCLMYYDNSNLYTEYQMLDKENGSVKALIWSKLTYINIRSGQRTAHGPELISLFEVTATEGEGKPDQYFEERVKELRGASALV